MTPDDNKMGREDDHLSLSGFYRPPDEQDNRAKAVVRNSRRGGGDSYKLGWGKEIKGGVSSGHTNYSQVWLMTFTDLVALLLTFFVLLYSMSDLKYEKWREITKALSEDLRIERPSVLPIPAADFGLESLDEIPGVDLDYLATLLQQQMTQFPLLQNSILSRLSDRLVLSLPDDLLFDPGSILLRAEGLEALNALGEALRHVDNRIEVAGHADPTVARDVSNWELSLMRAISTVQVLKKQGGQTLVARGYGDSRYDRRPAEIANRNDFARRVDIVVYRARGDMIGDTRGGDNRGGGTQ